jgi:hypothetical protein
MLEPSTYSAQLVQVRGQTGPLWIQWGTSKDQGTLFCVLTFKVLGGKEDGQLVQWKGFFTEKVGRDMRTGTERALETLGVIGFVGDDIDLFNSQTPHGRVDIVTEIEDYKGTKSARVKFVNSTERRLVLGEDSCASPSAVKDAAARIKASKNKQSSSFDPNGPDPADDVAF